MSDWIGPMAGTPATIAKRNQALAMGRWACPACPDGWEQYMIATDMHVCAVCGYKGGPLPMKRMRQLLVVHHDDDTRENRETAEKLLRDRGVVVIRHMTAFNINENRVMLRSDGYGP